MNFIISLSIKGNCWHFYGDHMLFINQGESILYGVISYPRAGYAFHRLSSSFDLTNILKLCSHMAGLFIPGHFIFFVAMANMIFSPLHHLIVVCINESYPYIYFHYLVELLVSFLVESAGLSKNTSM